jgi:hypothetical protein
MGDMSRNFDRSEFACGCGCGADHIDVRVVALCQTVRDQTSGFRPNSAVRCENHNREVGGEPDSTHVLGLAVDIPCIDSRRRFIIIESAIRMGARRFGVYKNFVHVDFAGDTHPCDVTWIG